MDQTFEDFIADARKKIIKLKIKKVQKQKARSELLEEARRLSQLQKEVHRACFNEEQGVFSLGNLDQQFKGLLITEGVTEKDKKVIEGENFIRELTVDHFRTTKIEKVDKNKFQYFKRSDKYQNWKYPKILSYQGDKLNEDNRY